MERIKLFLYSCYYLQLQPTPAAQNNSQQIKRIKLFLFLLANKNQNKNTRDVKN